MALPKVLKSFNVFFDGVSFAGVADEVQLPKLGRKMESHRAGGMAGPVKLDFGPKELEMEITLSGHMKKFFAQYASTKVDALQVRFVGALQQDDTGEVTTLEVSVRGRTEELDPGKSKAGDKTEVKHKLTLIYYRLTQSGAVLYELDLVNMVEIVNGEDRQAAIRAAIGM